MSFLSTLGSRWVGSLSHQVLRANTSREGRLEPRAKDIGCTKDRSETGFFTVWLWESHLARLYIEVVCR